MALSEPPPTRSFLDELACEEASAAVEFIVLIPVYMLLLGALFVVGNWSMARQQVVSAARFQAWYVGNKSSAEGNLDRVFFGHIEGKLEAQQQRDEWRPRGRPFRLQGQERNRMQSTTGFSSASNNAEVIAQEVFTNSGQGAFTASSSVARYQSGGLTFGGITVRQQTRASVILPRKHTREVFQQGQPHPATKWRGNVVRPDQQASQPLSPVYTPGGFREPKGIWETNPQRGRIKGSVQQEHGFFGGKLP